MKKPLIIEDENGNQTATAWPIEALLDLFAPQPEAKYPKDIFARQKEVARRYGLPLTNQDQNKDE